MKKDDGPRLNVFQHILQAFFGRNFWVEIAAQHVPHHDAVTGLELARLRRLQAAVGRAEERAGHHFTALLHIVEVVGRVCFPTVQVVERVVSRRVAFGQKALENGGMFPHIVADTEKSSLRAVVAQCVQHPRRSLRNGAVIEGKKHLLFRCGDVPRIIGQERLDETGSFGQIHGGRIDGQLSRETGAGIFAKRKFSQDSGPRAKGWASVIVDCRLLIPYSQFRIPHSPKLLFLPQVQEARRLDSIRSPRIFFPKNTR